jgi:transposase
MAKVYEVEFKVMIVELLNSGRKIKEVSDEYGLNDSMLRRWKREFLAKAGDFTKKKEFSQEELELKNLRKELREITMERDILKKAVSIFSKSDK